MLQVNVASCKNSTGKRQSVVRSYAPIQPRIATRGSGEEDSDEGDFVRGGLLESLYVCTYHLIGSPLAPDTIESSYISASVMLALGILVGSGMTVLLTITGIEGTE